MNNQTEKKMEQNNVNPYKSWLLSGAIIVVVVLWLGSGQLGDQEPAEASVAEVGTETSVAPGAVRVRSQTAEMVQRTIVINGKTAPARVATLTAETDGRVESIGAKRGASIKRGTTIVQLDKRDREARLAEARATVKQREVEYDGRLKLKSESYVSEAQLQEAVANLETAKVELKRAELDLDYMNIRAPFGGALQSRAVEIGDFVSVGDPIGTFVDNRTIIVSASLSEFDARYASVGDDAEARLATGETVRGLIRYVAPVADEATRTFVVELEIDNSDGKLRIGGTAELRVPAEEVLAHRVSPSLLTLDDAGNVGVKIVNQNSQVEFVVADIALSSNNGIWLAGLPQDATIITVGQGYVENGALVRAVPEDEPRTTVAIKSGEEAAD
jgi:multidrug efflux system membrane fusion protein